MSRSVTSDEKISTGSEFVSEALNCFCDNIDNLSPKETAKFINRLTNISRSMVMESSGIQDGYRLNKYWFLIIFCQMAIDGGKANSDKESIIEQIQLLADRYNWNYKDITEPMFDDTRTTMNVEYVRKFDKSGKPYDFGLCKVILDPTNRHPIGAEYLSSTGKLWKVCYYTDSGLMMCEPSIEHSNGGYHPKPFSSELLDRMKRVN